MSQTAVWVLAMAGFLCLAGAARLPVGLSSVRSHSRDFDYFMFVRQWPGTYCSKHSCPLLHKRGFHFTIHGLWPNFDDGSWPQFCDAKYQFDEAEVDDLEDDLEREWPSFFGSYEQFWEHEWAKHGTCALGSFPSEHKFFKAVLKLHRKYDLADALDAADILPSRHTKYRRKDLVRAIEHMYGARPLVHCSDNQLTEIWMCLDRHLEPFDCDPSHERDSCDEISIPPLKPRLEDTEAVEPSDVDIHTDPRYGGADQVNADEQEDVADGSRLGAASSESEDGDGAAQQGQGWQQQTVAAVEAVAAASGGAGGAGADTNDDVAERTLQEDFQEFSSHQEQQQQQQQQGAWEAMAHGDQQRGQRYLEEGAQGRGEGPGPSALQWLIALLGRVGTTSTSSSSSGNSAGDGTPASAVTGPDGGGEGTTTAAVAAAADPVVGEAYGMDVEEEEELQVPNGGAAAGSAADVSRGFVWSSRLRASEEAFDAGADDDAGVAVVSDGDADVMWAVGGVVVVKSGQAAAGVGAPPVWVVLLVVVQLACVAAISISLAIMAGLAIAGATWKPREAAAAATAAATAAEPAQAVPYLPPVPPCGGGVAYGLPACDARVCWAAMPQHQQQLGELPYQQLQPHRREQERRCGGSGDATTESLKEPLLADEDGEDAAGAGGDGSAAAAPPAPTPAAGVAWYGWRRCSGSGGGDGEVVDVGDTARADSVAAPPVGGWLWAGFVSGHWGLWRPQLLWQQDAEVPGGERYPVVQ